MYRFAELVLPSPLPPPSSPLLPRLLDPVAPFPAPEPEVHVSPCPTSTLNESTVLDLPIGKIPCVTPLPVLVPEVLLLDDTGVGRDDPNVWVME